jgi:hypothetical protein
MGVAGDTIGFVIQDRCIRSMQFLPADTTFIFNFSKIMNDKGSVSHYGYTTVGNVLYFLAEDGFYSLTPQGQVTPIGHEKVNDYWYANSDITRRNLVICIASNKPFIIWAYHSSGGSANYDKGLIFNWSNSRWTKGSISATAWAMSASTSLDLDTTGGETGDALADSAASSLDSFSYLGGRPFLGIVNTDGQLTSLTGAPLAATLETTTANLVPGKRAFVNEVEPLIDTASCYVAACVRERLADAVVFGTPVAMEVTGKVPVIVSGRLHRYQLTVPANVSWTNAQGIQADAQPDGEA